MSEGCEGKGIANLLKTGGRDDNMNDFQGTPTLQGI
jgi:hypothetical protein